MRKKVWKWYNDSGEHVGSNDQDADDTSNPRCLLCGEPSIYDEGQIDQDFMGNDIYGWWFQCFGCGIGTHPVSGTWSGDD